MEYLIIFGRSFFFYILIAVLYRLMGKREVGELSIMDLIVSIFIAQIASIAIENFKESIFRSIIPIAVLVFIQIISSRLQLKSSKAKEIIDGSSSVIISKGKINFDEMERQRYNIDDLLVQLRAQSVKSIEEVDYAILETSGKLSIFKKADDQNRLYPLPVIVDGKVQDDTLVAINKTTQWLEEQIRLEHASVEDIFYAFYKNKNLFIIKKENIS